MKLALRGLPFYNELMLPYHFFQSLFAALKYRFPARGLKVVAITGTNGKTTTAFMIWQMLRHAGYKVGLMTTVAWGADQLQPELDHMTTVDPFTLNSRIAELKQQGIEILVLEVTSHALAQFRILGIPVDIAVFTNLTYDHLDYHKTLEKYRAAKGKLFKKAKFSILNMDDSASEYYEKLAKHYTTYGIKFGENRATSIELSISGVKYLLHNINSDRPASSSSVFSTEFAASSGHGQSAKLPDLAIETQIPGEFNVYNSLAAALVGRQLKLTDYQIAGGIKSLRSVEGRMDIIDEGQPYTVIVDYAHSPDALEKVFASVKAAIGATSKTTTTTTTTTRTRTTTTTRTTAAAKTAVKSAVEPAITSAAEVSAKGHQGKIISVHGGAGRRDPTTRPIRGEILARNSDLVIITEDDSRDEDLETIMNGFVAGAEKAGKVLGKDLYKIPNRKDAIEFALKSADKGDLVLILGKGHEKTILRADGAHDFEDAKVIRKLLKRLSTPSAASQAQA